jgi:putative ABC transport system ATP-binding protein
MALIETRDIWKTYQMGDEEIHALRGVSIQIDRGEYVAIMGPSGSGKSTLMNLIGCLDTPSQGTYLLNGKEVSLMNDNELARIRNEEIGFVFQTFNLLPRATALHNVELPLVYAGVQKKRSSGSRQGGAREGRAHPAHASPAQRAVGRPAPACRHRARARQQPVDPAGRRADRQSRLEDGHRDHGAVRPLHAAGNTIILVTHEADIAAHAHRVIAIRDGGHSPRLSRFRQTGGAFRNAARRARGARPQVHDSTLRDPAARNDRPEMSWTSDGVLSS